MNFGFQFFNKQNNGASIRCDAMLAAYHLNSSPTCGIVTTILKAWKTKN
jgi:hypothetical protein